ncbi:MAG: hypothetical protein HUU48_06945 [Flavobacteriales bacterium]|nr:hypothetical protein [Flavobacteriales bacterium]
MKKCIFLLIYFVYTLAYSQSQVWVNKPQRCKKQCELDDLNKMDITYIELIPKGPFLRGGIHLEIDYGIRRNVFQKKIKLRTIAGKKMRFNSHPAFLNYFYDNNWELVKIENTYNYHIYTMKRKNK